MNKNELIKWANDAIQQWEERKKNHLAEEPEPINVRLARAILKLNEEDSKLQQRDRLQEMRELY
jgi:division protein CdvB (Snf7/Vps24/ESCRT-III family)